jgi:acyl-CoA thioesterase-1
MKQNLQTIVQTAKKRCIDVLLTGMEAPPNYGAAYTSEFRRAFSRPRGPKSASAFMPFFLYEVAGIPTLNTAMGYTPILPAPESSKPTCGGR